MSYKVMGLGATKTLKYFRFTCTSRCRDCLKHQKNVTYVTVASLEFRFSDTLIMRKDPWIQRNVHCFHNLHLNFQNILSWMLLILLFISILNCYLMSPDPVFDIYMLKNSHKIIEAIRFFRSLFIQKVAYRSYSLRNKFFKLCLGL